MKYYCWDWDNSHEDDAHLFETINASYAAHAFAEWQYHRMDGECPDHFEVAVMREDGEVINFPVHVSYNPSFIVGSPLAR